MSEHLSEQHLKRYRGLTMPPAELLSADDHLASCAVCRERAAEVKQTKDAFGSLHDDLQLVARAELRHLSYDQLAALVDDELNEVDSEIVNSHLELCSQCVEEMRDLETLRESIANNTDKSRVLLAQSTFYEKVVAFMSLLPNWGSLQLSSRMAILFVVVSVSATVMWVVWRSKESPQTQIAESRQDASEFPRPDQEPPINQPTQQPKPTVEEPNRATQPQPPVTSAPPQIVVALNDGDRRVVLDQEGNLQGLESLPLHLQQAVKKALTTRRVDAPANLADIVGRAGLLMGAADEGVSFALLSPVGTIVRTDRPIFRWQPLREATSYVVNVYDSNFNKITASPVVSGTAWTPPRSLARGGVYSWQVTAVREDKEVTSPTPPAPEARFKVLERSKASELAHDERSYARSHLMRGILYAQAGLLDDAEVEFHSLREANPESPVARQLLQNVQALRRAK